MRKRWPRYVEAGGSRGAGERVPLAHRRARRGPFISWTRNEEERGNFHQPPITPGEHPVMAVATPPWVGLSSRPGRRGQAVAPLRAVLPVLPVLPASGRQPARHCECEAVRPSGLTWTRGRMRTAGAASATRSTTC